MSRRSPIIKITSSPRGEKGEPGNFTVVSETTVPEHFVQFNSTDGKQGKTTGLEPSIDGTFASNSDSKIPTEKATKTYVDNNITTVLQAVYPVGAIYMSVNSTNPNTIFGFGTWTAWGTGQVPVGVDTGQTEFNTVEKVGGAKTKSFTHTHTTDIDHAHYIDHTHSGNTDRCTEESSLEHGNWHCADNSHLHSFTTNGSNGSGSPYGNAYSQTVSQTHGAGSNIKTSNTGTLTAADVLQPYITCYMFKRTA